MRSAEETAYNVSQQPIVLNASLAMSALLQALVLSAYPAACSATLMTSINASNAAAVTTSMEMEPAANAWTTVRNVSMLTPVMFAEEATISQMSMESV